MNKNRRIVITGIGPVCSAGFGKKDVWQSLLNKKTGLAQEEIRIDNEVWDKFWMHKLPAFDINSFGISPDKLSEVMNWKEGKHDLDLEYLLASIQLALADSKVTFDPVSNNVGLFLTIEHPGFEPFCADFIKEALQYLDQSKGLIPSKKQLYRHLFDKMVDKGYDLQTFMYLYLVAKVFDIHGYSLFTSNACASGLYSYQEAFRQIKFGNSDIAIVAGGDCASTMFKHMWFKERNLYAEDGLIKPFSSQANGIVIGDGATALVFEELDHAMARNAHIYAEVTGMGFSLEGWKVVVPDLQNPSYKNAALECLQVSNLSPEKVDLVCPHGVGLRITDMYEAKAINEIFGNKTPVCAFKPYVGHNLGGSGVLETALLLLAMENNTIPAALNCESFDERYKINLIRNTISKPLNTAIKLSCGFAGYNAAVAFSKI